MVGCVGNAPTLVRLDIRFTGGSRSLRGYQPRDGCGTWNAWRGSAELMGRGALAAWTPERQSHHDEEAYETSMVLNLPAILKWWTATALHRALPLARRVTS